MVDNNFGVLLTPNAVAFTQFLNEDITLSVYNEFDQMRLKFHEKAVAAKVTQLQKLRKQLRQCKKEEEKKKQIQAKQKKSQSQSKKKKIIEKK